MPRVIKGRTMSNKSIYINPTPYYHKRQRSSTYKVLITLQPL